MSKKVILKKFTGFAIVGVLATFLSWTLYYIFNDKLQFNYIASYILAYIIPLILSFTLNSIFVFKSKKNIRNVLVFFSIYLSSMVMGILLLSLYHQIIPHPLSYELLGFGFHLDAHMTHIWTPFIEMNIKKETIFNIILVTPITMSQNFTLSHFLLKKKDHHTTHPIDHESRAI
jgi:putative flippase GtrA